jgi:hypothetical protein
MATRDCWRCAVRTHLVPHGTAIAVPHPSGSITTIWCAFRCDNCDALSIATCGALNNHPTAARNPTGWIDGVGTNVEWFPIRAAGKDFPDVPEHITEAASEAYKCYSIDAFRAATQLTRSVVEATAKDKGITQGSLFSKINELFAQALIREYIRDGAHEVRHLGNDMAHGDFISPVSSEETQLALTLMSEILEEVYQSPARVARAQTARAIRMEQSITQ